LTQNGFTDLGTGLGRHSSHKKSRKNSKTTQIKSLAFCQFRQGKERQCLTLCLYQKGESLKDYIEYSLCASSENARERESCSIGLQEVRGDPQSHTVVVWKKREAINLGKKLKDDT